MSAPSLPTPTQIRGVLALWREVGLPIGRVRIASDAIEIYPPGESPAEQTPFDKWISEDGNESGTPPRS